MSAIEILARLGTGPRGSQLRNRALLSQPHHYELSRDIRRLHLLDSGYLNHRVVAGAISEPMPGMIHISSNGAPRHLPRDPPPRLPDADQYAIRDYVPPISYTTYGIQNCSALSTLSWGFDDHPDTDWSLTSVGSVGANICFGSEMSCVWTTAGCALLRSESVVEHGFFGISVGGHLELG